MIQWKGFMLIPVNFFHDGWYFWDETYTNPIGPYHSHIEASAQLLDYCNYLNEEGITAYENEYNNQNAI